MARDAEIHLCSVLTGRRTSDDAITGWLGTFGRSLELRLSQLLDRAPRIISMIHSPDAPGSAASTTKADDSTDVILLIISPGCFESTSFTEQALGLLRGHPNRSAIIKVTALPIAAGTEPAWLRDIPGYDLTESNGKSYWARLGDLAHDLAKATSRKEEPQTVDLPTGFAVYLADTVPGLEHEREMIRRVIERNGIMLLETHGRQRSDAELQALVRARIGRSAISIHMMEGDAAATRSSGAWPLVELELAEATARCRSDRMFSQLIWLPLGSGVTSQLAGSEAFRRSGDMAGEIDLLRISLEDLKTRIGDRIKRARSMPAQSPAPLVATRSPSVYLMVDPRDVDDARPLGEYLGQQGLDVILPRHDGDRVRMREHHQQSLRDCSAAMIYYGRVAEPWVRIKQQDLLKSAGFGRTEPMTGSAIFMGPEPTPGKLGFTAGDVTVIQSVEGFQPGSVQPFLATILG